MKEKGKQNQLTKQKGTWSKYSLGGRENRILF